MGKDFASGGDGEDKRCEPYDCIIMHTLISHVDNPALILQEARSLARDGATLIIVDGDYAGLSYHSADNAGRAGEASRALVTATFAQPGVVRDLPTLLKASGWRLESAKGKVVSEVGT